jgi:hypothetical protein
VIDKTAARARALGITAPLGEQFEFQLFGRPERASLHPTHHGYWVYRSASGEFGLGELRGLLSYGAPHPITELEQSRWTERLDWRADLHDRSSLAIPVPDRITAGGRKLAHGIGLLVGLRDPAIWPLDEPFTFAREFRMAYCGVSNSVARRGMEELERLRVIARVGKIGPRWNDPIAWRLAMLSRHDMGEEVRW